MFKLTDKERLEIKKKHEDAIKKEREKKKNIEKGLQKPEKK